MQSILQHRHFKSCLEQQIKDHGLSATANTQDQANTRVERTLEELYVVNFQGPSDPLNPRSWSRERRWMYTWLLAATGFIVSGASAFDTSVTPQAAEYFGVSEEVELLSTSLYMIALGVGSLISPPLSETVGRNPVYLICLTAFALFEMGAALATNIETQLVCRFFAALFGCPPITTFGGSMSDMWAPLDRTYIFPIISVPTFMFPFLAPVVADFIATSPLVSWRWTEWITMILAFAVVLSLFLFVPETYGPVLLSWKAKHLRDITGDQRYRAQHDLLRESLAIRLLRSIGRPIKFLLTEPIVDLFSLYLVIIYVILFGFLPGFDFIFGRDGIYGFDQRHTGLCFLAINVGFLFAFIPIYPLYKRFKRKLAAAHQAGVDRVEPEERLLFAMIGAPFMTISIFWMGWSSSPGISHWSPLIATAFFGFGMLGVFISCYQYLIDAYEVFAASALVGTTVTRYCVAGPLVIVSVPMYENLGVHWALTLVGCLSLLMTPVPYIFHKYGPAIRKKSKSAINFGS